MSLGCVFSVLQGNVLRSPKRNGTKSDHIILGIHSFLGSVTCLCPFLHFMHQFLKERSMAYVHTDVAMALCDWWN